MALHGPFDRAAARYPEAAIAHEHPDSTAAGMEILRAGGNAVDAAVAIAFASGVVMPAWTTIGGSGFMLVDAGDGSPPVSIEFPPQAPGAATPDMFAQAAGGQGAEIIGLSPVVDEANVHGPRSVGVPTAVAGLCEAHQRFGRLPIGRVIDPAVRLASGGFVVDPDLQLSILAVLDELRADSSGLAGVMLRAGGLPMYGSGLVVQTELARTLAEIGAGGPAAFYRGRAGEEIVRRIGELGGILADADLQQARARVNPPLSLRLKDAALFAPSSPSGGWTEMQILGVLDRVDGLLDGERDLDLELFLAVSRRCFADRFHFMADPEQVEVPLSTLLSDGYLDALAAEILERKGDIVAHADEEPWLHYARRAPEDLARIYPDLLPSPWHDPGHQPSGPGDSFNTTHLSVIDGDGLAVSCTLTAGHTFGSRMAAAGVILDDAMIWFNAAPGAANSIAPRKRPLANMGPLMIVHDDGRRLALGAPGGRRIISAVAQVAAHWLRGDSVEQATERPRVDGSGSTTLASCRLGRAGIEALQGAGRPVKVIEDRDRFCVDFARPVAVATTPDGRREAAVQPFVRSSVDGR